MLFLHEYIVQFRGDGIADHVSLADALQETKNAYDIFIGGNPMRAFTTFVQRYEWLGNRENKRKYGIGENLARNLPGALMQDYLLHLVMELCKPYSQLDVFAEVRVAFGSYPLWEAGQVSIKIPSEKSDLAVGYLVQSGQIQISDTPIPKQPYYKLTRGQNVLPLITINSKIRVSQSEFFDWLGRSQLMTKGNPHCLSVQVALRKEMDLSIVEAAQARSRFFLLGEGTEYNVIPSQSELDRLIEAINEHLEARMR